MDKSPFGRLAPELRSRIYELVLTAEYRNNEKIDISDVKPSIALTQACRQIRLESRSMFFASNKFYFRCSQHFGPSKVAKMLQALGADTLSQIRSLHIHLGDHEDYIANVIIKDIVIKGGDLPKFFVPRNSTPLSTTGWDVYTVINEAVRALEEMELGIWVHTWLRGVRPTTT